MHGPSAHEHTRAWAARTAPFDGFVMVTPEYNHSAPGVLKNALGHLFAQWTDKAVGFVSYGVSGGVRAVEQLRLVCGALGMADVSHQVAISLLTDFENYTTFTPGAHHSPEHDVGPARRMERRARAATADRRRNHSRQFLRSRSCRHHPTCGPSPTASRSKH